MHRIRTKANFLFLAFLLFISSACDPSRVYEDFVDFHTPYWHVDSVKTFAFRIEDHSKQYNLFATLRNTSNYPYYNIFFEYQLLDSNNAILKKELKEFDLFDPKSGKPRGEGLGDLFDHRIALENDYVFDSPGLYQLKFQQYMRMDTLPFLLSVGTRIEYAED